jgi:hypothetical protein
MKMAVFWDVAPCSLAEIDRRFRRTYCLHHCIRAILLIALMMEAVSTSETTVNFYQTTRRNIPEDSHLRLVTCLFSWLVKLHSLFNLVILLF